MSSFLSDSFYEDLGYIIESQGFLIVCYAIFAVALFVYLYTGLLICQQRVGDAKIPCEIKSIPKRTTFIESDTAAENWLIDTHAQISPLNITSVTGQCTLEKLVWENHDVQPCSILIKNTGQTVILQAVYSSIKPTINGASLPNAYSFVQLSFRWGSNSSFGADHMLNNQKFPLEMQALYRFGTEGKVLSTHDMLMVAFLFKTGKYSLHLEPITTNLKRIRKPNSKVKISPVPLNAIIPTFSGGFYCYIGSLIEPPYYEGVKWLVYSKPLTVGKDQLKEFRQLLGQDMYPIKQERRTAHRTEE